jgi:NitT/TauT family transport system ATP-binding protein
MSKPDRRVHIDRVTKIYGDHKTGTHALADISLTIKDGEFISIVGPSGCGKSTLLRLVSGLVPVTSGSITIAGQPVTKPVTDVGIVFQQPVLLDWRNILDNVLFQIDMRDGDTRAMRGRAEMLLQQVGLGDFMAKWPHELSGGMKQRAAIARALVHDPSLLIMDEPFGALDALTREQMRVDIENLWMTTRKTVIFITHSIDEAVLLSDRVVVMSARPGTIDHIFDVDMPRPRGLLGRRHPVFQTLNEHITDIFLQKGILRN